MSIGAGMGHDEDIKQSKDNYERLLTIAMVRLMIGHIKRGERGESVLAEMAEAARQYVDGKMAGLLEKIIPTDLFRGLILALYAEVSEDWNEKLRKIIEDPSLENV